MQMIFALGSVTSGLVLDIIVRFLERHGQTLESIELYGERKNFARFLKDVGAGKVPHFNITVNSLEIRFGAVTNYEHVFLEIKELESGASIDWDEWAVALSDGPGFIQGWISDEDYERWQNAEDPLQYESEGLDWSHLPTKSNGLPPPLEQTIIDTSDNPGRRIIRMGFVETIGATMWLGEPFWACVGMERKDAIIAADWAETALLENGVLRVQVVPECFIDESNRDLQIELRRTLFGDRD